MEPFSLVTFALGAAIGSIVGNRADNVFLQIMGTVTDRLRHGGSHVNHDLQRAVRKAYLQATLVVCVEYLKAIGVAPSLLRSYLGVVFRPSDEVRWIDAVRRAIVKEFREPPRAEYLPPSSEAPLLASSKRFSHANSARFSDYF